MNKQELLHKIKELEEELKLLEEKLRKIYFEEENEVEFKIKLCNQLKGKFELDELTFAAFATCSCGAGYAYPKNIGVQGSWYCSNILLGKAEKDSVHSPVLPFAFYEVKSENQPSAKGATTRPSN